MRRAFLSVVLLLAAFVMVPVSPASATPHCGITWGSLEKSAAGLSQAPVTGVRTGRHACYDRLVLDVAGHVGGYTVRYVPHITQDGSGAVIPTRGGAALQITVNDPAESWAPSNPLELRNVAGYSTFRQVVHAGTFEGYTTVGLGLRARLPFRVLVLAGPGSSSRLVVDVAHHW
ncbi:AMIN-like domain-containing (lipo)protein [Cellulomonas sp. McL0617]|uniref:AMIN-like domain-containing (lipo)protein n=1 Tax=Cellulomonas sp. McL0617 TaxID=3415675 RepID=UPI003CEB99CA